MKREGRAAHSRATRRATSGREHTPQSFRVHLLCVAVYGVRRTLFSHPMRLSGNAQVPSVTVRERARLAYEVARRFLSFSALLSAERTSSASTSALPVDTTSGAAASAASSSARALTGW